MGLAENTAQEIEFLANHGDVHSTKMALGSQIVRRSQRIAKGIFDFSVQGGAIGAIKLYDPVHARGAAVTKGNYQPLYLPPSAIVVRALLDVIVAPTSGGSATMAFGTGVSATDLLAATAKASLGIGLYDLTPNHTAANSVKVAATTAQPGVSPIMTVAVAALTAGKMVVHIEYYLSDT